MIQRARGRRAHVGAASSALRLRTAVQGLIGAVDDGADHLPEEEVNAAEEVLRKASERLAVTGDHTVVALAGATGSGKSTLFNAMVGEDIAKAGHLRPTTSRTMAAVWGPEPASALLDWLDVRDRHRVAPGRRGRPGAGALDGLVLLDLPDFDSHDERHRAEADRVLALADVFVWITDPQKYADAVLHDEYIGAAAEHGAVTLVLFNQLDRLRRDEAQRCLADLGDLLDRDGLPSARVIGVSAVTGEGLEEFAAALGAAVTAATAARERLLADIHRCSVRLRAHVADTEPALAQEVPPDLVAALARTAGVPIVLDAVERDYRRRAAATTGWPFTRWARALRPDPLRRLRLDGGRTGNTPASDELTGMLHRSSLPAPTPTARAGLELVTRRLANQAGAALPARWAEAVATMADPRAPDLGDALDRAVTTTPLHTRRPLWWWAAGLLQGVLAVAAVAGVAWLVALGVLDWLQIPRPDVPRIGFVPWPTALAAAGLLLGIVLAALARPLAAIGARRRRRAIGRRLDAEIAGVADAHLLGPVRAVLLRHRRTREHLDAAIEAGTAWEPAR